MHTVVLIQQGRSMFGEQTSAQATNVQAHSNFLLDFIEVTGYRAFVTDRDERIQQEPLAGCVTARIYKPSYKRK